MKSSKETRKMIKEIRFDRAGLVPAVVQDYRSGEVLMLAYMNKSALQKTLESGLAHYYSRSRKKLWMKGETSGHIQKVVEIRLDCDNDTILLRVKQKVGACHTGYWSCFYRRIKNGQMETAGRKAFSPRRVYR